MCSPKARLPNVQQAPPPPSCSGIRHRDRRHHDGRSGRPRPRDAGHDLSLAFRLGHGHQELQHLHRASLLLRPSNSGWTTASCPSTYTDYRYELEYRLADFKGNASDSTADLVASTSLTPVHNRMNGARIGTSIAFPNASYFEAPYFGYNGVYLFVSAYAKSRFTQSWPTDPAEMQIYFLPGTGDFDTHGMIESKPSNYCYAHGYSKSGC